MRSMGLRSADPTLRSAATDSSVELVHVSCTFATPSSVREEIKRGGVPNHMHYTRTHSTHSYKVRLPASTTGDTPISLAFISCREKSFFRSSSLSSLISCI